MSERKYGHFCLDTGKGKIWFRWPEDSKEERGEILTDDPGIISCLAALAANNPDVINILTEEGEENLHCIVGPELKCCIMPAQGNVEIWIEKLAYHGEE